MVTPFSRDHHLVSLTWQRVTKQRFETIIVTRNARQSINNVSFIAVSFLPVLSRLIVRGTLVISLALALSAR